MSLVTLTVVKFFEVKTIWICQILCAKRYFNWELRRKTVFVNARWNSLPSELKNTLQLNDSLKMERFCEVTLHQCICGYIVLLH